MTTPTSPVIDQKSRESSIVASILQSAGQAMSQTLREFLALHGRFENRSVAEIAGAIAQLDGDKCPTSREIVSGLSGEAKSLPYVKHENHAACFFCGFKQVFEEGVSF